MAAVKISGVLKDGAGKPIQNCTIQLKAKRNSTTVVVNTVASENPDEAGRYSMDVEYGQYSVTLLVEGFPPSHAGTITVYEGSRPGTLNDFLTAPDEGDLKPDVVKRFEDLTSQAQRSADVAISATKRAEALLSEMQGIADSFPGLRFENFDDIVSRCTTAMLKLEQPEVVNTSISLKIKENIDFNYVGAVNGYCCKMASESIAVWHSNRS